MAKAKKRKLKIHLSKKQRKQLKVILPFVIAGFIGLVIGISTTQLWKNTHKPKNIVWAADDTVKIPRELHSFLASTENDCKAYRGNGSPDGIGLWGVYQISKSKFAKIAYGCSWSLTSYIMAVKTDSGWQLLNPAQYFAPFKGGVDPAAGALPHCEYTDKYHIPGEIEPFCVQPDGSAKSNDL